MRKQVLLHDRGHLTAANDLVRLSPRQDALLDEGEFVALEILKGKFVADAEHFPVDEIHVAVVAVFDEKVVAE